MVHRYVIPSLLVFLILFGCVIFFYPLIIGNPSNQAINNTNQTPSDINQNTSVQIRVPGTNCIEVISGHNKPDLDRINIVFVPFNLSKESMIAILPYYIDFDGTGLTTTVMKTSRRKTETGLEIINKTQTLTFNGLLATDPFIANQDKFNFWYIELPQNITTPKTAPVTNYCLHYCVSDIEKTCDVPNIYAIYLCNTDCQSYGSWGNDKAYLSHSYSDENTFDPYSIPLFVHEFGHSFGGLKDEYYSRDGKSSPGYPNCAPNPETAEEWWGDLVGQGEGDLQIGYFQGCSYSPENIRPSNSSLMKSSSSSLGFNLVCKLHLQKKLDLFSGEYAQNIPKHELPLDIGNRD